MRVAGFEPIFQVAEVERAVRHYERLGFTTSHHDETYAFAHHECLTIHLTHAENPVAGSLYVHVDDADAVADDWRAAGAAVRSPENYDYGKREGSHADPDGNLIRFGSPIAEPSPT